MSKYTFPDLTTCKTLYKGKRYIAFEVGINNIFDEFEQEFDFIIWDGLYDAPLAYGTIDENGFYKGFLAFSNVEIEIDSATTINDFMEASIKAQARYFKDSGV